MDYTKFRSFITWILNNDGNGATDEEYAEFFVYLYKLWKDDTASSPTSVDMLNAPIDDITSWINTSLREILPADSECCTGAWWKQGVKA